MQGLLADWALTRHLVLLKALVLVAPWLVIVLFAMWWMWLELPK